MRKPDTSSANSAWEKEVQRNMSWMKKNADTVKMLTEKAKINGVSFEQQLRDDARWHAKNNGFIDPDAV